MKRRAEAMDVRDFNQRAWDAEVERGNRWTVPVGPDAVARARGGDFEILLTPTRPVPRSWFPPLEGLDVLCLASGGGQQGPLLAAAGARVTVLDNSPRQLAGDREVAERERLELRCVEGDQRDLSAFPDRSFALIVHPVSNCFVPEVRPVWQECFRVLRPGGSLLAGFNNPVLYLFDERRAAGGEGELVVRHVQPYSDLTSISEEERNELFGEGSPLAFAHTLTEQIGGQLGAGFVITGFYEDRYRNPADDDLGLARYQDTFLATRAVKPPLP